jgi:phenylacetate-CoA ligase
LKYRLVKEGPLFRKLLLDLEARQAADADCIKAFQDQKIKNLVRHCHENVPFYRTLFQQLKLDPQEISCAQDLARLSCTTKEDIRARHAEFLASNANRRFLSRARTSGTTGKPLLLYRDRFSIVLENAMIWRLYRWGGVNPGDRIATLRGYRVQAIDDREAPFWRRDVPMRRLMMSSYHISARTAPAYLRALEKFKPAAIEAYPSSIYSLVRHLQAQGAAGLQLKAVFTSSETLYEFQREAIESFFGCRIFDLYGCAERVCAAGSCEFGNYHLFSDYGLVEFQKIAGNGTHPEYEIIATGLHNQAMPILRYRIEDRAVLHERNFRCPCGRAFPVIRKIRSYRADEYLTTPDGRRLQSVEQVAEGLAHVLEYQLVQEDLRHITVRVVTTPEFSARDEQAIRYKARQRLGRSMEIAVEQVDMIARTPSGKYPFIVNRLRGTPPEIQ